MSSPFKNPELMVIGDSLAQGCRSLSVTKKFCAESYGAIIAREQAWAYNAPDFPRDVLFDLEAIVTKYLNWTIIGGWAVLLKRLQENYSDWVEHFLTPPTAANTPEWCDNLAVAGATLGDLGADPKPANHFSWKRTRAIIEQYKDRTLKDLILREKDALATLHLAINSGFVLNPRGLKKYANWTTLDWVEARKPKKLIVHMAHNDGLYPIGSNAVFTDLRTTTLPHYKKMIAKVMEVTDIKQQVIFVLLPKVSAVANLDIIGDSPDADGYWPRYKPVFSTSASEFDAKTMKSVDRMIVEVNRELRDYVRSFDATHWTDTIDAYEVIEQKDFKQTRDSSRQTNIGKYKIDNRYLRGEGKPVKLGGGSNAVTTTKWAFVHGGFQSMDGMHPSAVGYGEVAIAIAKQLNFKYDKDQVRKNALASEPLITRYPGGHQSVVSALKFLRKKPVGTTAPEPAVDEKNGDNLLVHTALAAQRACARC